MCGAVVEVPCRGLCWGRVQRSCASALAPAASRGWRFGPGPHTVCMLLSAPLPKHTHTHPPFRRHPGPAPLALQVGAVMDVAQMAELFSVSDLDGSGLLDYEEFIAAMLDSNRHAPAGPHTPPCTSRSRQATATGTPPRADGPLLPPRVRDGGASCLLRCALAHAGWPNARMPCGARSRTWIGTGTASSQLPTSQVRVDAPAPGPRRPPPRRWWQLRPLRCPPLAAEVLEQEQGLSFSHECRGPGARKKSIDLAVSMVQVGPARGQGGGVGGGPAAPYGAIQAPLAAPDPLLRTRPGVGRGP